MNTERDHLDAETVAAWLDGGLDAVSLAAAEAHASNCERCQALLATAAKTMPAQLAPGFSRGIRWWLAPIVATAAAVTLWMVVPQEQLQQVAQPVPQAKADVDLAAPAASARANDEVAPKATAPPPPPKEKESTERFAEVKRKDPAAANVADQSAARDRQELKAAEPLGRLEAEPARVAAAPPAPAAPAPAVTAPPEAGARSERAAITQLRKQVAPLEFVSPNPQHRWRVNANGIERSEDGGRTWVVVRLAQGETITAGASPAPTVCWIVGRGGLVLLATDGTDFTRLPFPEQVDLTAVSSPELRIAVVTAADGRVFRTENAGRTWIRQ